MSWAALALLCAPAFAAPSTRESVEKIFVRVEALEKSQFDQDAGTVRALDRKIEALSKEVLALGPAAVAPLAAVAEDPKRSPKTRLWAVAWLGLTRDPSALAGLESVLDDPTAPEDARSSAAGAIPGLEVSPAAQRRALCSSLELELPEKTLGAALLALTRLGCETAAALERRAKAYGGRPDATQARSVACAIQALARSMPVDSARALWRLFSYFPKGSPQRLEALQGLLLQRDNLKALGAPALRDAKDALSSESSTPENAVAAARLLVDFDDASVAPLLLRFLKNKDAEVVTVCAEGLAHFKSKEARAPVAKILDGVSADARFAPQAGRPDPAALVARLQKALETLDAAR